MSRSMAEAGDSLFLGPVLPQQVGDGGVAATDALTGQANRDYQSGSPERAVEHLATFLQSVQIHHWLPEDHRKCCRNSVQAGHRTAVLESWPETSDIITATPGPGAEQLRRRRKTEQEMCRAKHEPQAGIMRGQFPYFASLARASSTFISHRTPSGRVLNLFSIA